MPKLDWSATVMPFVEKYGKKFYDKFMELPEYIKGHMNPKEKETFIKEGKPSIKRYTVGNGNVLNEFTNGRGRNPYYYDGVYTSTVPLGYDRDYYGDYQFKLPWSRDEFSNRPRLVAESDRLEDVVQVDALDRNDPGLSNSFTFTKGPIERRELLQKESPGHKLAEATGLAVPNGKPVSLGQSVENTTDFGGRTDVFDRIPQENMFLDSLATKSGRSAMKQARYDEISSGVKNGKPGFGFATDAIPISDRFENPWYANSPKVSDAVNDALSEKYGSISNLMVNAKRNPSELKRLLDDVAETLNARLDAGEHDILPYFDELAESERHDAVRRSVENYASFAFTTHFDPDVLLDDGNHRTFMELTTRPRRIDRQLKLIDDIDKHANVPDRQTAMSSKYADETRRLGKKALNEFGYVPEYFFVYERGQGADGGSGTMRFLLPDEPDRPLFKGERILDSKGSSESVNRAAHRQFEQAHYIPQTPNRKFHNSRTIGELLTNILEAPSDKSEIANLINMLKNSNDATVDTNRKFDELAKRLYDYTVNVLESNGIVIDDGIARELSKFVNDRIDLYRKDRTLLP